ncbi:MAG: glycosyltransferase family 87 protein [Pseudomonadota bacterium]
MKHAAAAFSEKYPLIFQLFTTRLKLSLAALALLFITLAASLYAQLIIESEDLFTKAGPIIGGDFIVFRLAATVAGAPDMISIYEMANLKAMLQAAYPGKGEFNFAWMYPPTMSLLIAPFAAPPYLASFTLWIALFGGAFLFTTSRLWADKWALFFVAASPTVFQATITGQNGFLTATLLAAAGAFADRRPILAGVAAGLLTIKPQLGLLIPIAFIAAGCWRAFFTAAVTALLLAVASLAAYGPEVWVGFVDGVTAHGARMGGDGFPFNKLVTPFGFATMLGAPAAVASLVQLVTTIGLASYVFIVWRRVRDWDLRAAALSTAAMLATPYAFYYELVIMAPAMLLIARRAVLTGWLKYEQLTLIAVWIVPLMMPGQHGPPGLPACAIGAILAALIAARRAIPAAGVTFASAGPMARAGS